MDELVSDPVTSGKEKFKYVKCHKENADNILEIIQKKKIQVTAHEARKKNRKVFTLFYQENRFITFWL